ncbi:MAG: hypothetical protein NT168_03560 [Planctomycetota bacterium]|nr:hypothetical protein [Planctomycetota bacterium]
MDLSGCFIEGTLVTVSSLPGQSTSTDSLWSDPSWLDEPSQETPWLAPERYASVATRSQLQVPIESVPIGSRVPTKNPNRFEVDPQPEPDQATWAKLSITAEGSDGGQSLRDNSLEHDYNGGMGGDHGKTRDLN